MTFDETNSTWAAASLRKSWEEVYGAFAVYPPPTTLNASLLRHPKGILDELRSAPLSELSGKTLGNYAMWALTSVGNVEDYKHYLPRILQHALLTPSEPGFDPLLILSKLQYADWHGWPKSERTAIENVYRASWQWARLQHPDEYDAMNWLPCVLRLERNVDSALESWSANMTPNSALQLADIISHSNSLPDAKELWEGLDIASRRRLVDWLCGDKVQAALLSVVDRIAEGDLWRIDGVEAALNNLRVSAEETMRPG